MRRPLTAVFLSGWIGFLSVSAAIPTLVVMRIAEPGFPVPPMLIEQVDRLARVILAEGNSGLLIAICAALSAAMIASTLALAFWLVLRRNDDDRRLGERFALGGLVATGVLVAAVRWSGSSALDAAGSLPSFALTLGLSAAAILFDRMLDQDEEEEASDEGFRAALSLIGREMARDDARPATGRTRDPRQGKL